MEAVYGTERKLRQGGKFTPEEYAKHRSRAATSYRIDSFIQSSMKPVSVRIMTALVVSFRL